MISIIFYLLTLTVLVSSSNTAYQNSVCQWIRGTGNSTNRVNAGLYGTPNDCAIVCLAMRKENQRPNGASLVSNNTKNFTCWCEFGLTNILPNFEATLRMTCFLKEIIHQLEVMVPVIQCSTSIQFTNKRLVRHATKYLNATIPPKDHALIACLLSCMVCNITGAPFNCTCRSFNVLSKERNFACEMNSAVYEEYPEDLITEEGYQHYLVDSQYSKRELGQWFSNYMNRGSVVL